MSLFTDFVPKASPDNRHKFINVDTSDEIIIGGTCEHVFELGFNFNTTMKSGIVYYTQGLAEILSINIDPTTMVSSDGTVIKVVLNPLDTQKFKRTTLNTFCQLKFISKDDKAYFDEPHKLRVLEPIVVEPVVGGNE